ncbi:PHD and RING finger domain-containing protein 1 isoform X2 [Pelobates fuscus]|uniref:PHD and RING finger domain-containing protein 1 isoform X2 n=1 Tax=Pelobates fuscus TaxID=191477 RepID=UPI002FE4B3C6
MDDEENQDQLINRNSSQGKSRRQVSILASDDDDVEDSESGSDEEDDLEEGGEDEDGSNSEEEDDDDEDEDEDDLAVCHSDKAHSTEDLNPDQSSDEERENCPICLNGFRDQVVGTPENCNHYFCLDCIAEWSKNANSCPVDRITFSCIHIRAHFGGEILKKVPVLKKASEVEEADEDPTNCEVCGRSDREDRLLLCDGCDAGYHMECLTPALNAVPVDEWFCPECSGANVPQEDDEQVSEEEVAGLLADVIPTTSRLRPNATRTRAIARTRQSERVRANVNRNRITTARNIQEVPRYLMSSLLDETIETVVAGLNTAVYQRPLGPRLTTTKRKKRVGKKKTSQSKGARGVGKKRRRKFRRRKGRKQTVRKAPTSHSRIAKSLGLCAPSRGATLPRVHRPMELTLGSMRQDIGAATLSVFGSANDLDPFDGDDHGSNPTSPLNAKRRILSRSALRSHQPVARPISLGLSRGGVAPLVRDSVAVAEPVPDLLGSILSGQSMLMMKSSDIVISRDGSLSTKKKAEAKMQRNSSKQEDTMEGQKEMTPSHSGSSTTSSSDTWKPIEQHPQLKLTSSGLYSLSPSPSPPPASSAIGLERVPLPSSSLPGTSAFRLKNAFTPRVVQVQSSAARLASKHVEPIRFNGAVHKTEPPSPSDHLPLKRLDIKFSIKSPAKRLEISELPRIPKIKKETGSSSHEEDSKHMLSSESTSSNFSLPSSCVNQLTGRGDNNQLGRLNTTESKMKSSRQETHEQPQKQSGEVSSSHTSSTSSSRSVGSVEVGGGGLRITISRSSSNTCRQFSPSSRAPFRSTDGKIEQKNTPHQSATSSKRDKPVKNEIYDPFDPTGSDSGSKDSSPERPGPSSVPSSVPSNMPTSTSSSTSPVTQNTAPSSGVKVGAFRSFRFLTTHSNKISVSKLGPAFSDMSPSSKEHSVPEKAGDLSPVLPSYIKVEKEIKQEIDEEENNEKIPFKISCPLSGLKITSDLKPGGVRGFHFDSKEENRVSIKPDPEPLPSRVIHQSNRVVWELESPTRSLSLSTGHNIDLLKMKTTIKEEPIDCLRSRSGTRSQDRESRSASWSSEEERREKSKSKTHKGKRARSDRSSSGSCERSKKKRQKEKKKEKKRKNSESKERKRSRSSSRSSSSHRAYNSKKKKKKKRESRGQSVSPERDKKRKHKGEKNYYNKEGGFRVKEKKKPKEERGKQRSKSPQMAKEHKAHRSKDKKHLKERESYEETFLAPDGDERPITCTVTVKTEFHTDKEETRKTTIVSPKEDVERDFYPVFEKEVSVDIPVVKEEKDVEFSSNDDVDKIETSSPPWSPSLLDSIFPEGKRGDAQETQMKEEIPLLNELPLKAEVISPQASPLSSDSEPPVPKPHSPHSSLETIQLVSQPPVKTEPDDMQWSPSHLDDFLLTELSDDVCSAGAASPDDVDLEEAILMKREGDYKETPLVSFSKKQVIPFLQDEGASGDEEAGNHINEATTTNSFPQTGANKGLSPSKTDIETLLGKSKTQIKRVSWNLHSKDAVSCTKETSSSVLLLKPEHIKEEPRPDSPKQTETGSAFSADSPSDIFNTRPWNLPDTSIRDCLQQVSNQISWNSVNKPVKETSRLPWIATETPVQAFPQTLPPLPLPPIFPPYAPVSEPTIPSIMLSSGAMLSQTPKPGSLATANEPKMQVASTGEGKAKSKSSLKGEKVKNDEYMKKLHMQERAVEEVKLAIKPFYQKREITKDEYKEILRKAVQKICHSKSGEINPVKVVNLVKAYVDRYKHLRKHKKLESEDDLFTGRESPL